MLLLVDLARLVALFLVAAGAAGVATWLARACNLPRLLSPLYRTPATPEAVITELVELAQACDRDGLLAIEAPAAISSLPLLGRGASLAIAGSTPDEIRAALDADLERSGSASSRRRKIVLGLTAGLIMFAIPLALVIQFLAGIIAASSAAPARTAPLILGALPLFAALVCAPTLLQWCLRPAAAGIMSGMLVIEGLCLITKGAKPDAVRTALTRMLPGPASLGDAAVAA